MASRLQSHRGFELATLTALASVLVSLSLTGCAHQPSAPSSTVPTSPSKSTGEETPLAHYSRYTLIEMRPEAPQTDLLQQVVDVRIPATATSSVGDTVRYVLLHTGFRLCEDPAIRDFDSLPLPAAHMHLGPLPLATVLQLLVGRSWALEIDESNRRVCFSRSDAGASTNDTSRAERRPRAAAVAARAFTGEHE